MTFASSHNGGRSQVGLNFLQVGGDYPFINHVKTGQAWTFISTPTPDAPVSPATLDSDGYPTTISNGGVYTRFFIPPQSARSGNYKVDWLGIGTIYCPNASSVLTGSKTSATAAGGSFTFTPSTETIDLGISSIGATSITELRFYHVNDETLLNSGEIFGVKFKQRLTEGGFGVVRFLDWMDGNKNQLTTWWTRKTASYVHYNSGEYRGTIFCGTTSNSSNDYTASAPSICSAIGAAWDGVLRDKTTVSVIFNVSATQSGVCTLDVGGTGAKNILNAFSNPLSVGGNSYPTAGSSSSLATLMYDSTLDSWIKYGGDGAHGKQGINNGVPFDLMVRLCAELGAHPYFVAPAKGVDANTDFITELATYCRDNAPSWMIPRFEGPNELWNTTGGFFHATYANNKQLVANGGKVTSGVLSNASYSASALVYPTDVTGAAWVSGTKYSKITLSTLGNNFSVGSYVNFNSAWGGVSSLNAQAAYVGGINIGADPNTITVAIVPTSGTYTSGGAITPKADDYHNWYGGVLSRMGQDISDVYSNDRAKYQVLCGLQTTTGNTSGNRANSAPRLSSNSYVMRSPPAGYTASPASDWVTHICLTQYFNPTAQFDGSQTTLSAAYAGATFNGSISATTLTTSSPRGTIAIGQTIQGIGVNGAAVTSGTIITGGSGSSWTVNKSQTVGTMPMVAGVDMTAPITYAVSDTSVTDLLTLSSNWKTWAQGFGIQKMCGYEGNYSPDHAANGNSNDDRLKTASKLAPSLTYNVQDIYRGFVALSDGTFTAEFPSAFLFSTNPYINGYVTQIWALLDDIYQAPNSPQWEAARLFNARLRRFKIRT